MSEKKFIDQVKIFNSAKLIVAMHGAGLTNLLFCKSNTKVIEITKNFVDYLNTDDPIYMKLNDKKNIDWFTKKIHLIIIYILGQCIIIFQNKII